MDMVAKIALKAATYAIDKPYDYTVPAELTGCLRPGMRVVVPFGSGNRHTEGIVLALEHDSGGTRALKPVLTILDETPVLDGERISGRLLRVWIGRPLIRRLENRIMQGMWWNCSLPITAAPT